MEHLELYICLRGGVSFIFSCLYDSIFLNLTLQLSVQKKISKAHYLKPTRQCCERPLQSQSCQHFKVQVSCFLFFSAHNSNSQKKDNPNFSLANLWSHCMIFTVFRLDSLDSNKKFLPLIFLTVSVQLFCKWGLRGMRKHIISDHP